MKEERRMNRDMMKIISSAAPFPIDFQTTYYVPWVDPLGTRAPCILCSRTGKVEIKGLQFSCPRCEGRWESYEWVSDKALYKPRGVMLNAVTVYADELRLDFNFAESCTSAFVLLSSDGSLATGDKKGVQLTPDPKEAQEFCDRLNAGIREQIERDRKLWRRKVRLTVRKGKDYYGP